MKTSSLHILLFILFTSSNLIPCTTAIVSGKATIDGRPLLLKNRDADQLQNRLVYFDEGKLRFIGLVNSEDKTNSEVWCGFNQSGFGIMNSASYNLKGTDTTQLSDLEGRIMRMALAECTSLADFERMLDNMPKPLGVEANFGVIDAFGGAAYYETGNFTYKKFDANDPEIAPNGYLIRTNYSVSGTDNKGFGYIRYATASDLFQNKYEKDKISFEFLVSDVPRCLVHSYTKEDLAKDIPETANDTSYVFFRDYIPRYYSTAAVVVQGIKDNEDPSLTTMWSVIGFPLTSIIVPVWLLNDGTLPSVLVADKNGNAPLCNLALQLKDRIFPQQNDAKENYINVAALMNKQESGIRQKIVPVEDEVLSKAKEKLDYWRQSKVNDSEAAEFYNWIDSEVYPALKSEFGID
jgi:hypothetical protein